MCESNPAEKRMRNSNIKKVQDKEPDIIIEDVS